MRTYTLENRGAAPLYEYLYRCIREDILERLRRAGTPGAVQRQEDVERELARIREALGRYACQ